MHDNLRCACMQSVSIQIQRQLVGMGVSIIMDKIMVILQVNKKTLFHKECIHEIMVYACGQCDFYALKKCSMKPHKDVMHEVFTYWNGLLQLELPNPVLS